MKMFLKKSHDKDKEDKYKEKKQEHIDTEFSSYTYENKNAEIYIRNRLIPQIKWYDKKSQQKQIAYKLLMGFSLSLGALVPVLSGFRQCVYINFAVSVFGGTSAILLAFINLNDYQKLWIQYRTNCEIIKSNLHRFSLGVGDYKHETQEDAFEKLVISCEDYLLQEFRSWNAISNKDENN